MATNVLPAKDSHVMQRKKILDHHLFQGIIGHVDDLGIILLKTLLLGVDLWFPRQSLPCQSTEFLCSLCHHRHIYLHPSLSALSYYPTSFSSLVTKILIINKPLDCFLWLALCYCCPSSCQQPATTHTNFNITKIKQLISSGLKSRKRPRSFSSSVQKKWLRGEYHVCHFFMNKWRFDSITRVYA